MNDRPAAEPPAGQGEAIPPHSPGQLRADFAHARSGRRTAADAARGRCQPAAWRRILACASLGTGQCPPARGQRGGLRTCRRANAD